MKAATISQLKKELVKLDHDDLLDVCLRMAKFSVACQVSVGVKATGDE